ncbi:hypothetical protein KDW_17720 [Dictyobacter vulcani]|uniref:histidine kinase n=1 Tax=Dictyobacter vulcani TaxID=2607529 RepID=A0A5J4KMH7_9CHLR|nr:sensor histidine kinase [Dictyobacter vulcani]GER87610.1 hypothetical protein KDW_17720 [Dictyobacter vulcani]
MDVEQLQTTSVKKKHGPMPSRVGWLIPTNPYTWSTSFLYLFELGFGLFWLITIAAWWLLPIFIVAILALFLIDRIEYLRYGEKTPERIAVLLLILRFVCVEMAILIAPSLTPILYLLFPFRAMLYFGRKAAYAMAALIVTAYFASFWLDPRMNHDNISVIFAFIFCVACILSVSMAHTMSLERESRMRTEALLDEVQRSHQQLRIYAQQVAALATMEERNRVARDIHDSLGHSLIAINLQLEKALVYHDAHPQEALQSVGDARIVAKTALQDVRRSVHALRTEAEHFSCIHEVASLSEQLTKNGLSVDFTHEGDESRFSRQTLMTLYRIAQEGLTNVQKHAHASHIQVHLHFATEQARLHIVDDGIGFDATTPKKQQPGQESYGLRGMQERLTLLGGTFQLISAPGQGTRLTALVKRHPDIPAPFEAVDTSRK